MTTPINNIPSIPQSSETPMVVERERERERERIYQLMKKLISVISVICLICGSDIKNCFAFKYFYGSGAAVQQTGGSEQGSLNQPILRIGVVVTSSGGPATPLTATSFDFVMANTADADVVWAKLFYTGLSSTFSTATQLGAMIFNPSGTITFNFSQDMAVADTFFYWLAFDVDCEAAPGNLLDANVPVFPPDGLSFMEDGSPIDRTPIPNDPAGSRTVTALTGECQSIFQKTYGGGLNDLGWAVEQTNDGGYIVAGSAESFGAGAADFYLIKTDANGDTLWTRTYGGGGDDFGRAVEQTTDGGYIVAGYTTSFGAGVEDVYLIKTDTNGDTLWTKTYGGAGDDRGWAVEQTTDGGYIVAGGTLSFGAGGNDVYLIKTDANGDTLWTRTYGGSSFFKVSESGI